MTGPDDDREASAEQELEAVEETPEERDAELDRLGRILAGSGEPTADGPRGA